MLTELPSGDEVNCSVRTLSPLDGAISSVSIASRNAFMPSALAVAELVASSASNCSRLATLIGVGSSNVANTALIRGSTRGSSASLEAMTSSYIPTRPRGNPTGQDRYQLRQPGEPFERPLLGLSIRRKPLFVCETTQPEAFVAL